MLKELQLAELETMSPWQVKLCPLRRNWLELEDWPWFLLDEQGWKEGLLSFFCSLMFIGLFQKGWG